MKNQAIFELYTDDNKSKYSCNPKDILKSGKEIIKLYTKWTSTAATTEVVCKNSNIKKISNERFNLFEYLWYLETLFNELVPVLLGVYESWGKFDTMGVTSRGIISPIRTLSRMNYFRKTKRHIKREAPK